MEFDGITMAVLRRLKTTAEGEPVTHYADEDTFTFTREELTAIWSAMREMGAEITSLRNLRDSKD